MMEMPGIEPGGAAPVPDRLTRTEVRLDYSNLRGSIHVYRFIPIVFCQENAALDPCGDLWGRTNSLGAT